MSPLTFTIVKQSAEQDYLIIALPLCGLTLAQWRAKGLHIADQALLKLLLKEEGLYQQKVSGRTPHLESMPIHLIHISKAQALAIIEKLAETQRLYFNNKQLVVDLYTPVELYYQGEITQSQALSLTAKLKWQNKEIALTKCDAIGPGRFAWFITGIALKRIDTKVAWKELKKAYYSNEWLLQGAEINAFLKQVEEEEEGPRLRIEDEALARLNQKQSPLPILVLQDRLGAFANLWMDYGSGVKVLLQDLKTEIKEPKSGAWIKRELQSEKNWEQDLLETDFILKQTQNSYYYCPTHLITKSLLFLLEIGWNLQDYQGRQIIRQQKQNLTVSEKENLIQVKGAISFGEFKAEISQVVGAFNRRDKFVALSAHQVGLLDPLDSPLLEQLAQEGEIMGEGVCLQRETIGKLVTLFDAKSLSCSLKKLKESIDDFTSIEEAPPSSTFLGSLRRYQQVGLNWLFFLHRFELHGILADDMGLGKTVQVIALLSKLKEKEPHLIIAPTSLLFNWRKELEKFLPSSQVIVHHGPNRSQRLLDLAKFSIILTSYGTMRADAALLSQLTYHCLILDEAQEIKNSQTLTAQTLYQFQAKMRLCMTGTPIENHASELWSHFRFLIPGLLGELETFQKEVEAGLLDSRHLKAIKKKVAPFILRRTKQEVLTELPKRIDQLIFIEMDETQRALYDDFLASYQKNLLQKVSLEGASKHRIEIFEAILRLRQICCHPLLLSSLQTGQPARSLKMEALQKDLETIVAEGGKALIYSQFSQMLQLMKKEADANGWPYCYLDGQTKEREKEVDKFQNAAGPMLFFISLKAGGVGLNLTAADSVILYDPWWNEAVEEQAINRAHRMGREKVVVAKRFIIKESIEEKIMKLKESKKKVIEQLFEESSSATSFSAQDLYELLS